MSSASLKIGLLALQGDYQKHREGLERAAVELGRSVRMLEVRTAAEVAAVDGLVLPGGESSTMLKLLEPELEQALVTAVRNGLPVLATCAGCILLAAAVENPEQRSLGLIDIDVRRNAYGRQVDSFIDPELEFIDAAGRTEKIEGVFIRAPRMTRIGSGVQILAQRAKEAVAVRSGKIFAATFHPELSEQTLPFYRSWLETF